MASAVPLLTGGPTLLAARRRPSSKLPPLEPLITKPRIRKVHSHQSEETTSSPGTLSSMPSDAFWSEASSPPPILRRSSTSRSTVRRSRGRDSPSLSSPRSSPLIATTATPQARATPQTSRGDWSCQWQRGAVVGSGSFGTVYRALNKTTSQIFAVKEALLQEGDWDGRRRKRLDEELSICQGLRHRNIVSYLGHEYTDTHLLIYLEYMPGGSVAQMLASFGPLDAKVLQKATAGVLCGLDYLHTGSIPVVHRDIKGANVLVDLTLTVKLADFGCSKCNDLTKSFSTLGSIPWMAPEVMTPAEGHGRKADIWSFGCTVIEMATAEKPWGDKAFDGNILFALNHIGNTSAIPPMPKDVGPECADFIRLCIQRDQHSRPTTTELLCHSFAMAAPETTRGSSKGRQAATAR